MICMQNDAPASGSGRSAGISLAKHLSFTAVLAALCCVSTVFFVVPLPASGYFNMGDVFVLLSGWLLGPLYGAAAAGLGTMLADVVGGYASYAPATLVIKAFCPAPSPRWWARLSWCWAISFSRAFCSAWAWAPRRISSATPFRASAVSSSR